MKQMKSLALIATLLSVFSLVFATKPTSSTEKDSTKAYETLTDALESGKPVMCLFYTTQNCHCTIARCKSAVSLCDSISDTLFKDIVYFKMDIGKNKEIAKKYKLLALPTAVFFNEEGKEITRLQSWQMKRKDFETAMQTLTSAHKKIKVQE